MGLKQLLDNLKLSAKDAVIDGERDSLNHLKRYLHIDRTVEHDLGRIITKVNNADHSSLILLLGNVGDGKSHLLSRMWEIHGDALNNFHVHNDATESTYKNKTYLENLAEVFGPYRDSLLNNHTNKVKTIIAINLGTLTNFLEQAGSEFNALKTYVEENHLVDLHTQRTDLTQNKSFVALNLTDYNIFDLGNQGAHSKVLLNIIEKITIKSDKNPFFRAYIETYRGYRATQLCPIKYNFDLLSKPNVQNAISELLIKVILADKLIISVRLLMNLVYDLIVPADFSSLTEVEILRKTTEIDYKEHFYKHTFTALLFDSQETSNILKSIHHYDPLCEGNEYLDELVIKISTAENAEEYFDQNGLLDLNDPFCGIINVLSIPHRIALFLRLQFLSNFRDRLGVDGYSSFINYLYQFNVGSKKELLNLYKEVQYAIYQWNGTTKKGIESVNLDIGRKQSTYQILQKLQLQFSPLPMPEQTVEVMSKFMKNLRVAFQVQSYSRQFILEIDLSLYQLILKINKGYRPNRIDKSVHVKFTHFVNELTKFESENKELVIQEFNGEERKKFKLTFIPGFEDFQFIRIE